MTRDQAVAFIQEKMGFRSGSEDSIVANLQAMQTLLEQGEELPWFLVEEAATLTLSEGDTAVTLPTGFIREVPPADSSRLSNMYYISSATSKPVWVRKYQYQEMVQTLTGTTAGPPQGYAIRKSSFEFLPAADQDYTLYLDYFKAAEVLGDGTTENAWLTYAPYYLIGEAGALSAKLRENTVALEIFQGLSLTGKAKVERENELRADASRTIIVGRKN